MRRCDGHGVCSGFLCVCFALGLLVWVTATTSAVADPRADFSRAIGYDLSGDEANAFSLYLRAARAGLPDAQFDVAVMYDSGRGIRQDEASAALFFAFAAINGHARAAYNLALLYGSGDGVPRNSGLERAWFREAARLGFAMPEDRLGASQPVAAKAGSERATPAQAGLVYPGADAVLQPNQDFVPLVWTSPAGPASTGFYVQLVSLTGPEPVPVLTETCDVSAIRAPIGRQPGRYAWRVFTFAQSIGQYVATPWSRFSIM